MKKLKDLFKLFITFFKIGLFTFGGGYAMIAIMQSELVERRKWISEDDFYNVISIAESTPGPIAINMATFLGYKKHGVLGSIFATLGVVLPSFIIIFIISLYLKNLLAYSIVQKAFKGIACAVAVIILFAGIKLLKNVKKNFVSISIFIVSAILMVLSEINVINFSYLTIFMIITGGIIGVLTLISSDKQKGGNE